MTFQPQSKSVLTPVLVRLAGIVILLLIFVFVWIGTGAVGGSFIPLTDTFFVLFFYAPIIFLVLSTVSLLRGRGSQPFNFLPKGSIRNIINLLAGIMIVSVILFAIFLYLQWYPIGG